jgi:vitamin B12/bleomycin/antimicrobial peptide transport system ATP-binding/permease protein
VVGATAAAQVSLNAWNGSFYEAIAQKNVSTFLHELSVFAAIASGLLVLNVAQAWLCEMIKLSSREWLTRDLLSEWLKPGQHAWLAGAGEFGVNPDQRIHEDAVA